MSGIDVRYTLIQTMSFCWNIHSLTEDIFRINSAVCQLSKDVEVRIKATSLKINMQSRVMPGINVIFILMQMITFTDMIQLIAVLWRRTFHQHQHQHRLISTHSPKAFPTCQPQLTSLYLQYKSFPTPQSSNSAMVGIPGYTGGKIEFTS